MVDDLTPQLGGDLDTNGNSIDVSLGNLDLDNSTSTTGNITKNGTRFLHDSGCRNLFLGLDAGNFTMTGGFNTVTGYQALFSNTTGEGNIASGAFALFSNTTGINNTATGYEVLHDNTSGIENVATGRSALRSNRIDFRD